MTDTPPPTASDSIGSLCERRANGFLAAANALPGIVDRLAKGQQFNAYDSAQNEDDDPDDECEMHVGLGPITDFHFIVTLTGRQRGEMLADALTLASRVSRPDALPILLDAVEGGKGETGNALSADEMDATDQAPWHARQPIEDLAKYWKGRQWVPLDAAISELQFWQRRDYEHEVGRQQHTPKASTLDADRERIRALLEKMSKAHPLEDVGIYQPEINALLASPNASRGGERYQHKKRGTVYEVVGTASLQIATVDLVDGSDLVIYRGDDGRLWEREMGEFHDGRFERIDEAVTNASWDDRTALQYLYDCVDDGLPEEEAVYSQATVLDAMEGFARIKLNALAQPNASNGVSEGWKREVTEALIASCAYVREHDTDPVKAVRDLVECEVRMALDPAISGDAQRLWNEAIEVSAKVANDHRAPLSCFDLEYDQACDDIATAIRALAKPLTDQKAGS